MIFDPSKETRPEVLAAEEEYFGCKPCFEKGRNRHVFQSGFNAGAASRDAEVVSLTNQRDYEYVRAENAEQERDQLREQLAAALAACKMKDETLQELDQLIPVGATIAALAIQPDDAALKAWLGEPVRYLYQIHNCYGVPVWIDNYPRYGETVLETLPLYAPKGMK